MDGLILKLSEDDIEETVDVIWSFRLEFGIIVIDEDDWFMGSSRFSESEAELGVKSARRSSVPWPADSSDLPFGSPFAIDFQDFVSRGTDWPVTKTWMTRWIPLDCA